MVEIDSTLVKMEHIKREDECCCCSNKEDLYSLLEPYNLEDDVVVYSTMIAECFRIELSSHVEECNRHLYLICKNCILRLKDAFMFRTQIQNAYERLQAECWKKNPAAISSKYSDIIETKEHILKYDISEIDNKESKMIIGPGVSLSNENVPKLKHLKIVLKKIDNTIEHAPIVSDNSASKSQPSKIFFCNVCKKSFKRLCALQNHKKTHLNTNTCKYCNKTLKTNYNLLVHEKMHLDIRDFICDYCKKAFRHKEPLKEHILLHMGIKNIKCDLCDKCFVSNRSLSNHKNACHSIKLSCKYCNRIFKTNHNLLSHEKMHLDIKDFICDYCERGFIRKSRLMEHILLHMGIKNIKCDLCDQCFVSKLSLWNHKILCHSNKLSCKYCNKTFKRNHNLLLHEKMHLDIKDFICDYCTKAFRQKVTLKEHILLHVGIKNIKCDLCDKCFVSKMTLSNHKRACHAVKLPCNVCGKTFKSKCAFNKHVLLHSDL